MARQGGRCGRRRWRRTRPGGRRPRRAARTAIARPWSGRPAGCGRPARRSGSSWAHGWRRVVASTRSPRSRRRPIASARPRSSSTAARSREAGPGWRSSSSASVSSRASAAASRPWRSSARPRRSATRVTRMSRRVSSPPYEMEIGSRVGNGGSLRWGAGEAGAACHAGKPAARGNRHSVDNRRTSAAAPDPAAPDPAAPPVRPGPETPRPRDSIGAGASAGLGLLLVDADGDGVLSGTTTGPLVGDGAAVDEHLPTPDTPWLLALLGAGEAGGAQGAGAAEPFGPLQFAGRFGEVEFGALLDAGQCLVGWNQLQDLHGR